MVEHLSKNSGFPFFLLFQSKHSPTSAAGAKRGPWYSCLQDSRLPVKAFENFCAQVWGDHKNLWQDIFAGDFACEWVSGWSED